MKERKKIVRNKLLFDIIILNSCFFMILVVLLFQFTLYNKTICIFIIIVTILFTILIDFTLIDYLKPIYVKLEKYNESKRIAEKFLSAEHLVEVVPSEKKDNVIFCLADFFIFYALLDEKNDNVKIFVLRDEKLYFFQSIKKIFFTSTYELKNSTNKDC